MSPFTKEPDGGISWQRMDGDSYLVTGIDRHGNRVRRSFPTYATACCLNVWQGTRWLVREGKRYRIQTIRN